MCRRGSTESEALRPHPWDWRTSEIRDPSHKPAALLSLHISHIPVWLTNPLPKPAQPPPIPRLLFPPHPRVPVRSSLLALPRGLEDRGTTLVDRAMEVNTKNFI